MGKQTTELLKGVLEGIVLAILSVRPAYGYEITAWLRERGFTDIAEGTVYALLVRIEKRGVVDVQKVPSEKGPPRKVYSTNEQGMAQLESFWEAWDFLSERLGELRSGQIGGTGQSSDDQPGTSLSNTSLSNTRHSDTSHDNTNDSRDTEGE